jgi:hypothetical protein
MVIFRSSRKRDLVGGRVPKRHLKLGYRIYLTEGTLVREFDLCRTTSTQFSHVAPVYIKMNLSLA